MSSVEEIVEQNLLYDFYGELLTKHQQRIYEAALFENYSLGEIAEELQVSRQGVYDNLNRAEALLRNMEAKTGCVRRDMAYRKALKTIRLTARELLDYQDSRVSEAAMKITAVTQELEE